MTVRLRRNALAAALLLGAAGGLHAQTTGGIAVRAVAGDSVAIASQATGLARTTTIDADGHHHFSRLPPGTYVVSRNGGAPQMVTVGVGAVPVIDFENGLHMKHDLSSQGLSTRFSAAHIADVPVLRDTTSVALLAPGTVRGDAAFGNLASFGGASVAENQYFLNGLDITRSSRNLGFALVPFEAISDHRISTVGRGAGHGRALGGVVDQVTRRGTNKFQAGGNVHYFPEALTEAEADVHYANPLAPQTHSRLRSDNSADGGWEAEANAWASGALVHDRLFAYGLVAQRRAEADAFGHVFSVTNTRTGEDAPAWLLKLDWNIAQGHLLELTGFSTEARDDVDTYLNPPGRLERGAYLGRIVDAREDSGQVASYTGQLTDAFTVHALFGRVAFDTRRHAQAAGAPPSATLVQQDRRRQFQLGGEWQRGAHRFAFGYDRDEFRTQAGTVEQSALHAEDHWRVGEDLVATLGGRWDRFEHTNARGNAFFEVDGEFSPRLGVAWDARGDGSLQVFGQAGRHATTLPAGSSPAGSLHPDTVAARNLEPVVQDEYILGFRQQASASFEVGARAIFRELKSAIEDTCDYAAVLDAPGSGFTFDPVSGWWLDADGQVPSINEGFPYCRLFNPGRDAVFVTDYRGDGRLTTVTVPGAHLAPPARRTYSAVELSFRGEWDQLSMQGSYTYALSEGNYEGSVNSDIGGDRTHANIDFDYPQLARDTHGYLPNDRRHNLKLFGAYRLGEQWSLGFNVLALSGRPVNCLGVLDLRPGAAYIPHPYGSMFMRCGTTTSGAADDSTVAVRPRGTSGRLPWAATLDLNLAWQPAWAEGLRLKLDVFNVFDSQKVTSVVETAESVGSGEPSSSYLLPRTHQAPRSVRLMAEYAF